MARQPPALQEASRLASQAPGLQAAGNPLCSPSPAGGRLPTRFPQPGRERVLEACPPLGTGPWQQGLCGLPPSAALPLTVSSETGHFGRPTTATVEMRRSPSVLPAAATCAAVLRDVTAPGPLASPPLLSKARARDGAHVQQSDGQLQGGASGAPGHSLGLCSGVWPPAPQEEPPEGAGEREPPTGRPE